MIDRDQSSAFPARLWFDRFRAALPKGSMILDLGCGGGEPIARYLIDQGFHVTGLDKDPAMIDLARTRFPRETWIHGDMRTIAIGTQFEGVIAWNSLTRLSRADQARMAERAARWLKPGGRLLFNVEADKDSAASDYRSGSPYHAELGPADYSAAIAGQGLIEMAHVARDPACNDAGIWLARKP
ncbi:MAG: class I SAM-dependent methyltransferase [Pseudomonadota bacterium]